MSLLCRPVCCLAKSIRTILFLLALIIPVGLSAEQTQETPAAPITPAVGADKAGPKAQSGDKPAANPRSAAGPQTATDPGQASDAVAVTPVSAGPGKGDTPAPTTQTLTVTSAAVVPQPQAASQPSATSGYLLVITGTGFTKSVDLSKVQIGILSASGAPQTITGPARVSDTELVAAFTAPASYALQSVTVSVPGSDLIPFGVTTAACDFQDKVKLSAQTVPKKQAGDKYGNGVAKNFHAIQISIVNECPMAVVVPLAGMRAVIGGPGPNIQYSGQGSNAQVLIAIGGDGQFGSINSALTLPLTVSAWSHGGPVPNLAIKFDDGGAGGTYNSNATTGPDGTASMFYTLPATAKNITITVSSQGYSSATFAETATLKALTAIAGNDQAGNVGTTLPIALTALASNQSGAATGVTVTFSDGGAGGSFGASNDSTGSGTAGADGKVSVIYTLPNANEDVTITATSLGYTPATFVETAADDCSERSRNLVPFSLDHVTSIFSADRKLTGRRIIYFNTLQALATLGSSVELFLPHGFAQAVGILGGGFTAASKDILVDMSAEQLQNLTSQSFGATEQVAAHGSLQKFLFVFRSEKCKDNEIEKRLSNGHFTVEWELSPASSESPTTLKAAAQGTTTNPTGGTAGGGTTQPTKKSP